MATGLHIKFSDCNEVDRKQRISNFTFNGRDWIKAHDKEAPDGRVFLQYCPCGANDWTDNGRFINEYECNCCGQYIETIPHLEGELYE